MKVWRLQELRLLNHFAKNAGEIQRYPKLEYTFDGRHQRISRVLPSASIVLQKDSKHSIFCAQATTMPFAQ